MAQPVASSALGRYLVLVLAASASALPSAAAFPSVAEVWQRDGGKLPPPMDAAAPIDARVAALLALMTVEEKVAQVQLPVFFFEQFANVSTTILAQFNRTGLGLLYNSPSCPAVGNCFLCAPADLDCNAGAQDALQAALISMSRLPLPASVAAETLHSGSCGGAVFPIGAALGASWDTALVRDVAATIAREARIVGVDLGFAPLLGVFTDPRAGRSEENFGGDPTLVAALGMAFTDGHHAGERGGPSSYLPRDGLVTEGKHYAAYGYDGRDGGNADISDDVLFDVYLRPWRDFASVGGRGVMASHNAVQGVPMHMSMRLLTDVLRQQFGLKGGFVTSDDGDVRQLMPFRLVTSESNAASAAVVAGIDVDLSLAPTSYQTYLATLVAAGTVPVASLDRATSAVLRYKFAAGLFDNNTFVNKTRLPEVNNAAARALTRRAAVESAVLLKNVNGTLPLDLSRGSKARPLTIAVLGGNAGCADSDWLCFAVPAHVGGYAHDGAHVVTVLEAFSGAASRSDGALRIEFAPGASPGDSNGSGIAAAVEAARGADVAVVVLGHATVSISLGDCGEEMDADDLDFDGAQGDLLYALLTMTSTPVVLVLIHGRPLTFGAGTSNRWLPYNGMLDSPRLGAVLATWRPGQEGGNAILDLLTGAANPSGRLAQSWPRHVGQLKQTTPWLQGFSPASAQAYAPWHAAPSTPLFPFGFGLSYSTVAFTSIDVSPGAVASDAPLASTMLTISVGVESLAGPAGLVVVEVYFNVSAPTRRGRFAAALLGFAKVALGAAPARARAVIVVPLLNLAAWDAGRANYTVDAVAHGVWAAPHSCVAPVAETSAWLTVTPA